MISCLVSGGEWGNWELWELMGVLYGPENWKFRKVLMVRKFRKLRMC